MIAVPWHFEQVNRVDTCKAKYHLGHVTPNLWHRVNELRFRQWSGKEQSAFLRADGNLCRAVRLWYLHLAPRVRPDTDDAVVVVVVFLDGSSEHLPYAHRVHFLCPVRLLQRSYPSVHECRCQLSEHKPVGTCKPLHVLQRQFVVLGVPHLSIVNHTVYVKCSIVREAQVLVLLRHILDDLPDRPPCAVHPVKQLTKPQYAPCAIFRHKWVGNIPFSVKLFLSNNLVSLDVAGFAVLHHPDVHLVEAVLSWRSYRCFE